ncbi:YadA-like family protein [Rappaport israeli]|uniref:YadA-like family protein n=1 Tax=Rappaport israeli TaxID=1839807 RepID=UPI0009308C02|nr:YadA-like family protein [Rappaport israeli]
MVLGDHSGAFGDPSYLGADFSYAAGNDNLAGPGNSNINIMGNNNSFGATGYYYHDGENYKLINDDRAIRRITGNPNSSVEIKKTVVDNAKVIGNDNYVSSSNTYILGSHVGVKSDVSPKSIGRRRVYTFDEDDKVTGSFVTEIYTVEDRVIGTQADSVYLGDYSTAVEGNQQQPNQNVANITSTGANGATTTAGTKGTVSSATIDGTTYGNFAGAQSVGGVTVGASGKERRVMNVAAGELSATSTDAVNGSQLFALASRPVVRNTYVVDNTTVSSGDGNIVVSRLGDNYSVRLASSLQVDSVATGDVALNQEGLSVDGKTYVSQEGLDANYKRVQHVYPARVEQGSWDAVNGHQLYQMQSRLDEVDMRGRSGVASAMATAMLPQEYLAGTRAISAGVAHFRGESALAVGGSMVSDNGRWIVKGAVNMNRNDAGLGWG